jgi:ABC-type sugar transport system substrate-binding protein
MIARLVITGLLLTLLSGAPHISAEETARQEDRLQIAFSVPGLEFDYFNYMLNAASQRAVELGADLVNVDGQVDPSVQSSGIRAMIDQGVDGIIISPIGEIELAPAIQDVIDAGIPVVTIDRGESITRTVGHVGPDNVRGGEIQGELLLSLLPQGGKVIEIQGFRGTSPATDRSKGFNDTIAHHPEIELVYQGDGQFSRDVAGGVTTRAIEENPDIDAIVCANDDMCLGAAEVAKNLGLEAFVIGFDAIPEALIAVQNGHLTGTLDQWTGRQAGEALTMLVNFIQTGTQPPEHTVLIEPTLITAANLGTAERASEADIVVTGTPASTPEAAIRYD